MNEIVPYLMSHNAEAEACDVLMEIEHLDLLQQYVDDSAFPRVCLYLTRYVVQNNSSTVAKPINYMVNTKIFACFFIQSTPLVFANIWVPLMTKDLY